jgi:hypothetical protein
MEKFGKVREIMQKLQHNCIVVIEIYMLIMPKVYRNFIVVVLEFCSGQAQKIIQKYTTT